MQSKEIPGLPKQTFLLATGFKSPHVVEYQVSVGFNSLEDYSQSELMF